jgi:transcriptional antiterminator RfaH
MADDALRWYAARAKPGHERVAMVNLARQDFPAYYPQITIERRRRDRIVNDTEPLFPGYILIQFELAVGAWKAINGTRGIIRLLGFGDEGTPSPLPIGEIERLQDRETSGSLCVSEVVRISRDDVCRIKFGNAVDKIGPVLRTRGERITLLLDLLGRKVPVTVPMHALEVVHRADSRPMR